MEITIEKSDAYDYVYWGDNYVGYIVYGDLVRMDTDERFLPSLYFTMPFSIKQQIEILQALDKKLDEL